jgi:purine-binding chemotaxis protein CheW
MNESTARLRDRLGELRRTFDRSFTEPPPPPSVEADNLLAIGVAGDPYAVRLREISALFADRTTTPLPGSRPELLGVGGFRGSIIPVYDLARLLGYPGSAAPRWLVVTAGVPPVAFAFDSLDGHLRVAADAIARVDTGGEADRGHGFVGQVVHTPKAVRSVVDVPALCAAIATFARSADPTRKR